MSVGHYENFPVASLLLPAALREPVGAIYRFARGADDIADEGDDAPEMRLEKLRNYRMQLEPPSELASLIRRHDLPVGLFEDLLDAFAQDVTKKRYANFPELLEAQIAILKLEDGDADTILKLEADLESAITALREASIANTQARAALRKAGGQID